MRRGVRLPALAAAFTVGAGIAAAGAQTVVVRKAAPGATVEFVLDTTPVGTATVDADGDGVVAREAGAAARPEMDAYIYVDACPGGLWRVTVAERSVLPPSAAEGCVRTRISGLFLVKPQSTLLIDVSTTIPSVLLRQGSVDLDAPVGRTWDLPTGFIVSAGAGVGKFNNLFVIACGDAPACDGGGFGGAFAASAAWWFGRFVAAEVTYLRPLEATVTGSGTGFTFESPFDAHLLTVEGKIGIPIGRVRLLGHGGTNFHRAAFGTIQTVEDTTITVDGVTVTVPGGRQTFSRETDGWGWNFGGGLEVWLTRRFALYADAGRTALRGNVRDDGEGEMQDALVHVLAGFRFKIGR